MSTESKDTIGWLITYKEWAIGSEPKEKTRVSFEHPGKWLLERLKTDGKPAYFQHLICAVPISSKDMTVKEFTDLKFALSKYD